MNQATETLTLGDLTAFRICVVGSGFFGSVIAERVANQLQLPVLVLERRKHIGGNSWSSRDSRTEIDVHHYGSHIFHTSNEDVWRYINLFTSFNNYCHKVRTIYKGQSYSMPINLNTINQFFKKSFSPSEVERFLLKETKKTEITEPKNFEEKALSQIGSRLYEAFIKGYSEKQWDTDLKNLPASIISRLPVRTNADERYFEDNYQGIPSEGYGAIFEKMLSNPLISVRNGVDFIEVKDLIPKNCLIVYTGPIDQFFNFCHGRLGWRTLRFESEHLSLGDFQGNAVINYAEKSIPFIRIHEFRHLTPERLLAQDQTIIFREYSKTAVGKEEPYYPINTEQDKRILEEYKKEASKLSNIIFGGRLATYKYIDMHQAIGSALSKYENEIKPLLLNSYSY